MASIVRFKLKAYLVIWVAEYLNEPNHSYKVTTIGVDKLGAPWKEVKHCYKK